MCKSFSFSQEKFYFWVFNTQQQPFSWSSETCGFTEKLGVFAETPSLVQSTYE